jgi:hypothetical protein
VYTLDMAAERQPLHRIARLRTDVLTVCHADAGRTVVAGGRNGNIFTLDRRGWRVDMRPAGLCAVPPPQAGRSVLRMRAAAGGVFDTGMESGMRAAAAVTSLAAVADGMCLLVGGIDGSLALWDRCVRCPCPLARLWMV